MKKLIIATVIALIAFGFCLALDNGGSITHSSLTFFSFKFLIFNLLFLFLSVILGFFGFNIHLGYLLIEIVLSGFFMNLFISNFGLKGLSFFIFYLITCKLVCWFFLLLCSFYIFKIQKNILKKVFQRSFTSQNNIKLYLKKVLVVSFLYAGYIFSLWLLGDKILLMVANYLLF